MLVLLERNPIIITESHVLMTGIMRQWALWVVIWITAAGILSSVDVQFMVRRRNGIRKYVKMIQKMELRLWGHMSQTNGVFTICMETFGNGALTGRMVVIVGNELCEAVGGLTEQSNAALGFARDGIRMKKRLCMAFDSACRCRAERRNRRFSSRRRPGSRERVEGEARREEVRTEELRK